MKSTSSMKNPLKNMWATVSLALISSALVLAWTAFSPLPAVASSGPVTTKFSAGITPGSYPGDITAGPDSNLWFTEPGSNQIGRITPSGVVTEFSSGTLIPGSITTGPDSNLWFTNQVGTASTGIGRITPSGAVTEFGTGTPRVGDLANINDITTGPDGNLWFTEVDRGSGVGARFIGQITPSGVVTKFPTGGAYDPNNHNDPVNITSGPDGNLWFNNAFIHSYNNSIGRMTPTGTLTEFGGLGGNFGSGDWVGVSPGGITTGPDGNIWFTGSGINSSGGTASAVVGRMTPLGVVTEFSSGTGNIVAGPDGNLWFAESGSGQGDGAIGRITPAGVVTEFPIAGSVGNIAIGPGGIWFTQPTLNEIGLLNPIGVPSKPRNVNKPTITGKLRVKRKLKAHKGRWEGDTPIAYNYLWKSCNKKGKKCRIVHGAKRKTLSLRKKFLGHRLQVVVTAGNAVGSAHAGSNKTPLIKPAIVKVKK